MGGGGGGGMNHIQAEVLKLLSSQEVKQRVYTACMYSPNPFIPGMLNNHT